VGAYSLKPCGKPVFFLSACHLYLLCMCRLLLLGWLIGWLVVGIGHRSVWLRDIPPNGGTDLGDTCCGFVLILDSKLLGSEIFYGFRV
jgi:hypothetical protein